jgi:hypothetical protein
MVMQAFLTSDSRGTLAFWKIELRRVAAYKNSVSC